MQNVVAVCVVVVVWLTSHAWCALAEERLVGQEVLLGIHHVLDVLAADEAPVKACVRWAWQAHPLVSLSVGGVKNIHLSLC